MKPMTDVQRRHFFCALHEAAVMMRVDDTEYRHQVLREELGIEHLREVNSTSGFEKLMSRLYKDSGNYEKACDYVCGDNRRLRYIALKAASEIVGTDDEKVTVRYVAGLASQMYHLGDVDTLFVKLMRTDGWSDFTGDHLRSMISALVRQRRRLL